MTKERPFIGRKYELNKLNVIYSGTEAALVVIRGRRRIGKSRLIEEFAKGKKFIKFSGLTPQAGMTAKDQRENFVDQFQLQFKSPRLTTDNWNPLFQALAEKIKNQACILLFDEISWMAHDDYTFLAKLKNFWDDYCSHNPRLLFVLCSSISLWVDENIINGKAFYGRVHAQLTLEQLSLSESRELMQCRGIKGSSMEILAVLSITGGVPWYLELFSKEQSIMSNIKRLCFEKDGPLVEEFERIFEDLFSRRANIYREIVLALASKKMRQEDLAAALDYSHSSRFSAYLHDLEKAGFIKNDIHWSFKTGKIKKQKLWRLSDNYLRFYFKYIEPKKILIQKGLCHENFSIMESFSSIMGLQFENLVLNNRQLILTALGLDSSQIEIDNPYFQIATKSRKGCQIDYLIQTKTQVLFVCEIKFSKRAIQTDVIEEMREKIKKLEKPKNFSCLPVLIHVNGVADALEESAYFYKLINFSLFL